MGIVDHILATHVPGQIGYLRPGDTDNVLEGVFVLLSWILKVNFV
jgi:hypothetical protein